MAAASTIIMAGAAVASTGMGVYKASQARKQMREAQRNIDNYQRQTLENTLEGIAVPQQMFNLQQEQLQRSVADAQEAAVTAGARGLAFLPGIQESEFAAQQEINANLEQSLYQLSMARAQEEQRTQAMRERREEQELAGYGAMYEAGRQTYYSGIGDAMQGVSALGQTFAASALRKQSAAGASVDSGSVAPVSSDRSLDGSLQVQSPTLAPMRTAGVTTLPSPTASQRPAMQTYSGAVMQPGYVPVNTPVPPAPSALSASYGGIYRK